MSAQKFKIFEKLVISRIAFYFLEQLLVNMLTAWHQ